MLLVRLIVDRLLCGFERKMQDAVYLALLLTT
jgi:hypothetical protein